MFGQYLEEKGEVFREEGANPQQAVDLAVAELLGELSPTVQVPGRVGGLVRHILGYQQRFRKMPGRHPSSFIKRPGFGDALDYLCAVGDIAGKDRELGVWWKKYARENPPSPTPETAGEETGKAAAEGGRRRRRRKRRRGTGTAP